MATNPEIPIIAPRRPVLPPKHVRRPQLVARLNEGLAAGNWLTLVSAPPGFGKSTCIAEWVGQLGLPVAWLSLAPADDDPVRFVGRLAAALHAVDDSLGRGLASLLDTGALPPTESLCTVLLDPFASWDSRCVLVLDDYEVLEERSILELVETLAVRRPPQLRLVLISRDELPLSPPRLRAGRLVTELCVEDLRFAGGETAALVTSLARMPLSADDIGRLEDRLEGQAAGLQLAAVSLRGQANPSTLVARLGGAPPHILAHLMEEVLSHQPAQVRDFLVQTSILNKLSGELCDAVTGRTDGRTILEALAAADLFLIPLDDEGRWYCYHPLFAEWLHRHRSQIPRHQIDSWHRRASAWYAAAGLPADALDHALAGQDFHQAANLLEQSARLFALRGRLKTVEGWLNALPAEWRSRSPRVYLAFAGASLARGHYAEVARQLGLAQPAIFPVKPPGEGTGALLRPLQAEWYAVQANLLANQGRSTESLAAARLALQLAPVDDFTVRSTAYMGLAGAHRLTGDYIQLADAYQKAVHYSRAAGNSLAEMSSVNAMSIAAIEHGHLRYAHQIGLETLSQFEGPDSTPPPMAGTLYGMLGQVEYEWNRLDEARQRCAQAVQLNTLAGHNAGVIPANVILARVAKASGDPDTAARLLREAAHLVPPGASVGLAPEVVAEQVRLYLAQGRVDLAEAALAQHPRSALDPVTHPDEPIFIAQLRLRLYRAQASATGEGMEVAVELADRLVAEAVAHQRLGISLQALLVRAEIHTAQGHVEACCGDLMQALHLAQPEGYIRTFVDEGPAMARLLSRLQVPDALRDYVSGLMAAFAPP